MRLDNDHGEGVHNHLCPYITIILRDGYKQRKKESFGESQLIGFRSANTYHIGS